MLARMAFGAAGRNGYLGINNQQGGSAIFARFTFATPISAVGALLNYCPDCGEPDPIIQVFGEAGNLLESYDLAILAPIGTPNGFNAGAFRGIQRLSADIHAIEFIDGFQVVDDLTFSAATAVPEPASLVISAVRLLAYC
jgi:hypothetical protein